jgi:hypothetical protein
LITGISGEREYIRDGKVIKMVIFELTDNRLVISYFGNILFKLDLFYCFNTKASFVVCFSGKCECALFGEYANDLQRMVGSCGGGLPVAVVQFAKIKAFRGCKIELIGLFICCVDLYCIC